jgi:polyisoprenoid-binding protein YceI
LRVNADPEGVVIKRISQRALMVATASLALSAFALPSNLSLQPASRIWVKGGSTVRDYTCNAKTIEAKISTQPTESPALPLEQLVRSGQVSVRVADVDCGNGTMNEHMRKALRGADHPQLSFVLDQYFIEATGNLRLLGKLTMAGQTRDIEFTGTVKESDGGVLRVEVSKQIRMTEWGIKPPRLIMGTLKVHDPVTIGVDLLLKR